MKYLIQKGSDRLPLFWGPDGWQGNSQLAIKYPSEADVREVMHILELDNDALVKIREVEE